MTVPHLPDGVHAVLGAGPVGRAIARHLAAQGASVRLVSRSGASTGLPATVAGLSANLADPAAAAAAVKGARVVYHCAAPAYERWVTEFPALQDAIIAAAAAAGARLVVLDNTYGYGVAGTLTEDTPMLAAGPKGKLRATMAKALLAAHHRGEVQAAVARAADVIGPEVRMSALGERFWPALLKGKGVAFVGGVDAPHSFTYVPDLAAAMIRLGAEDAAQGQAWHVPSLAPITPRQLAAEAARIAGIAAPKLSVTPDLMMRLVGLFVPAAREVLEVAYQFREPFELSFARYESAFGEPAPTPLDRALAETIGWWRAQA